MGKIKTSRLQIDVEQELFRRAKAIAAYSGTSLTDAVHHLLEDYVERAENEYLDKMLAKKLAAAHDGKPVAEISNLAAYYELMELEAQK